MRLFDKSKKLHFGTYRFPDKVTDRQIKEIDQRYLQAFIMACYKGPGIGVGIRQFDIMKSDNGAMHRYM
jgi:hypothetical protein